MDLSNCLQRQKNKLKPTKTLLTNQIGQKFEIFNGIMKKLDVTGSPFVVDEKPDLQVASIIPGLYLSSQDPVFCQDILRSNKIKHILSLGINPEIKFDGIKYHYVEILDIPEFAINILLKTCIDTINLYRSENILVHCNAGVSRSPTIVIGYLMIQEKMTYKKAYDCVKTIRNCIRPNDGFIEQLKSLESQK